LVIFLGKERYGLQVPFSRIRLAETARIRLEITKLPLDVLFTKEEKVASVIGGTNRDKQLSPVILDAPSKQCTHLKIDIN
jgi:hypothetical protein